MANCFENLKKEIKHILDFGQQLYQNNMENCGKGGHLPWFLFHL